MNLPFVKRAIILCVTVVIVNGATLAEAYQQYNRGYYAEALQSYLEVDARAPSDDAQYGVINSYVGVEKYKEALAVAKAGEGEIFRAKEVWVLGILNKKSAARNLRESNGRDLNSENRAVFLRSGGWGFYKGGNYREALQWFGAANDLVESEIITAAIQEATIAEQNRVLWSATVLGGPIVYEQTLINDSNGVYQYKSGNYFSFASQWDIGYTQTIELSYSRFNAYFQPMIYRDPAFPSWDMTITADPKYQNTLYGGYSYKGVGGRPFDLGGAVILTSSNIPGIEKTTTAYVGHINHIKKMHIGAHWYGTLGNGGDSLQVGQVTPDIGVSIGPVVISLLPTALWTPKSAGKQVVSGMQYSFKTKIDVATEHTTNQITATWGDRVYASESGGRNMVTIIDKHHFTGTYTLSVNPKHKALSLFTLLRYENYSNMSRLIALFGVTVSL